MITQINGQPVADRLDLFRRVSGLFANTTVTLQILRGSDDVRPGRAMNMQVQLSKKRIDSARPSYAQVQPPIWRGMQVEYATASPLFVQRSRDLDPDGSVAVVEVARDSAAWRAGLRPGDFVSHVRESRVTTPDAFFNAVVGLDEEVALKLTAVERDKAIRLVAADSP